jgi:hypothetical protein
MGRDTHYLSVLDNVSVFLSETCSKLIHVHLLTYWCSCLFSWNVFCAQFITSHITNNFICLPSIIIQLSLSNKKANCTSYSWIFISLVLTQNQDKMYILVISVNRYSPLYPMAHLCNMLCSTFSEVRWRDRSQELLELKLLSLFCPQDDAVLWLSSPHGYELM